MSRESVESSQPVGGVPMQDRGWWNAMPVNRKGRWNARMRK